VLGQIVHLLHPIAPFVTEALWKQLSGGERGLLIAARWPQYDARLVDRAAMAEMGWVVEMISAIRRARVEMNVPAASEIAAYVIEVSGQGTVWFARHGEAIRERARLSAIAAADARPREALSARKNLIQVVAGGATLSLDLAGTVDLAKEQARLAKEAAGAQAEVDKIMKKLGNEQFLAKAKPEVVEEQRERLAEAEAALARVRAALDRIG
jgi:valyl-tRNA synthetase